MSYVEPPPRMPLVFRLLLGMVERRMGKKLEANRILTWYPKALVGSGVMEALVAHDEREVPRRLLTLIRVYTSFRVSCPFCIDLNAREFQHKGISDEEILALQDAVRRDSTSGLDFVASLSPRDRAALRYAECICKTPLAFSGTVLEDMKRHFSERGIVIVASTCAQVNFWARLIQSLGVPPAGFSAECSILNLEAYRTLRP